MVIIVKGNVLAPFFCNIGCRFAGEAISLQPNCLRIRCAVLNEFVPIGKRSIRETCSVFLRKPEEVVCNPKKDYILDVRQQPADECVNIGRLILERDILTFELYLSFAGR